MAETTAADRVGEYLRQYRRAQGIDPATVHHIWTDRTAKPARLDVAELAEVLRLAQEESLIRQRVADALALCRDIRPDSVIGTHPAAQLKLVEAVLSRKEAS